MLFIYKHLIILFFPKISHWGILMLWTRFMLAELHEIYIKATNIIWQFFFFFQKLHKFSSLSQKSAKGLAQINDYNNFYTSYLKNILHVRVPGTVGHHEVKLVCIFFCCRYKHWILPISAETFFWEIYNR